MIADAVATKDIAKCPYSLDDIVMTCIHGVGLKGVAPHN